MKAKKILFVMFVTSPEVPKTKFIFVRTKKIMFVSFCRKS